MFLLVMNKWSSIFAVQWCAFRGLRICLKREPGENPGQSRCCEVHATGSIQVYCCRFVENPR